MRDAHANCHSVPEMWTRHLFSLWRSEVQKCFTAYLLVLSILLAKWKSRLPIFYCHIRFIHNGSSAFEWKCFEYLERIYSNFGLHGLSGARETAWHRMPTNSNQGWNLASEPEGKRSRNYVSRIHNTAHFNPGERLGGKKERKIWRETRDLFHVKNWIIYRPRSLVKTSSTSGVLGVFCILW